MVAPAIIAAGISAAGSVLGGALSGSKGMSKRMQNFWNKKQLDRSDHAIEYRVKDAKKAGIHPIYALGAQTSSPQFSITQETSGLGAGIANASQDIGRAIAAGSSHETRQAGVMNSLMIEKVGLENDLLRANIAKTLNATTPPALPSAIDSPIVGQGDTRSLMSVSPVQSQATQRGFPNQEAGAVSDISYVRTGPRSYAIAPSSDAKQRIEDTFGPDMQWSIRNQLLPAFGIGNRPPPSSYLPKGYTHWRFNPLTGEYIATGSRGLYGEVFK